MTTSPLRHGLARDRRPGGAARDGILRLWPIPASVLAFRSASSIAGPLLAGRGLGRAGRGVEFRECALFEGGDALVGESERPGHRAQCLVIGAAVENFALALREGEEQWADLRCSDARDHVVVGVVADRILDEVDRVGIFWSLAASQHVGNAFGRPPKAVGQLGEAGLAAVCLPEALLCSLGFMEIPERVSREAKWPALLGEGLLQGLAHPGVRPGHERGATRGVIAFDRANDSECDILFEVFAADAATLVASRQAAEQGVRQLDAAGPRVTVACDCRGREALNARVLVHAPASNQKRSRGVDRRLGLSIGEGGHATEIDEAEVVGMASRVRADGLLDDLDAIGEQMSRALGLRAANGGVRGWLPPVDIWESSEELVIEIDAPGCKPEDLAAEVVDNQLVVSGERSLTDKAARRYRSERWQGRFVRTFVVPPGVDNGSINAEYVAGVLRLRVPKPEQAKPRRITIANDRDVIEASPADANVGAPTS